MNKPPSVNSGHAKYRVAIFLTYPIHYKIDLYKKLSSRHDMDVTVYFGSDLGIKPALDKTFGKTAIWYNRNDLEGLSCKFLKNYSPNRSAMPVDNPFQGTFNPGIVSELFKNRYDAIFMDGYMMPTHWLILLFAPIAGTAVVLRGESNLLNRRPKMISRIKDVILPLVFKRASAFLYIGTLNKEYYLRYRVPEKKLFFAPYTVNNKFFIKKLESSPPKKQLIEKNDLESDKITILYASKLIERKRPLDLLMAYEKIIGQNQALNNKIQIVFAGDGPVLKNLKEYSEGKNISGVHILGFKNQEELAELYTLADIFVLPSSFETWGLVINEAMNFSLPVITTNTVGSSYDLVKGGENGFVYRSGDVNSLADDVLHLIENKNLREKMGEKSLEIIKRWSYEETATGMVSALEYIKNPCVIVANPGSHHLYQAAIGLQRKNLLKRYATSIYFKPDRFPYYFIKLLPKKLGGKIDSELRKRRYKELDDSRVRALGLYEWLYLLNSRLFKLKKLGDWIIEKRNKNFSTKAGRLTRKGGEILWAAMDGALEAFREVKDYKVARILDCFIGHPLYLNSILDNEIRIHPELKNVCKEIMPRQKVERLMGEMQLADKIIVGSEFAKKTYIKNGVPKNKISVIPYGVDTNAFTPPRGKISNDVLKILFVGNISVRKGCYYILEALEQMNNPKIKMRMIGTMEDKYFLDRFGNYFEWVPHVSHSQIASYFQDSDILVLPSLFEGSALVVYEALASGLPVITTKNTGSIVRDGQDGFIIPAGNIQALKEKIMLFYSNKNIIKKMSKNARNQVEKYTWRKYHEQVVSTVSKIQK